MFEKESNSELDLGLLSLTAGGRLMSNIVHTREALIEIINALPIAIAILDKEEKIVLVNTVATELADKHYKDMLGKYFGQAFNCIHRTTNKDNCIRTVYGDTNLIRGPKCKDCGLRKAVEQTFDKKIEGVILETQLGFIGGEVKELKIQTKNIKLDEQDVVLFALEDTTKAKKAEELRLKEMQFKTALETVGGVSHELSQPIMIVQGYADLLMSDLDEDDPLYQGIKAIRDNTSRMGSLVKDLQHLTSYENKDYLDEHSKIMDLKRSAKPKKEKE